MSLWDSLDAGWRAAFTEAWSAFCAGTVPIGAAVTDNSGKVLSTGRNRIFDPAPEPGQINGHRMAHAEVNALLRIDEKEHPDIRTYTLTTTMEPCPMCFGTIVMVNFRNVRYAARDRHAGATDLNGLHPYIQSKGIHVEGPFPGLEAVQIALHTYSALKENPNSGRIVDKWALDCPEGVENGKKLLLRQALDEIREKAAPVDVAFAVLSSGTSAI